MNFSFDIPTAFFLVGVIGAIGATFAAATLKWERDASLRPWLAYAAVQSVSCFLQATRGQLPENFAVILGKATQLLAVGLLWLGARRLRGVATPMSTAFVPAAFWLILCMLPEFARSMIMRQLVIWPLLFFISAATTFELWRIYRNFKLKASCYLSIIISLVALLCAIRFIEILFIPPYVFRILTVIAVAVMGTAVPFITIIIASQRMLQLKAQREAEASSAARAKLERLHSGLPAVIFLSQVAPDGTARFIYRSGDEHAVMGWPVAELTAASDFQRFLHADDPTFEQIAPQLLRERQASYEWRMRQPSGGWRWMHTLVRVLSRNPDGTAEVVGYTVDVSAQREAEGRAMAVAHEIKQPLQSIFLGAEIAQLAVHRQDAAKADRMLEIIVDQTQRAANLIERLRCLVHGVHTKSHDQNR